MEAYTWITRQVGKRGAWEPYQLAALPYPPTIDDKITMQRWANPACQLGDTHKASFVLDFDAHAEWLDLDFCLQEVQRFLSVFIERWHVSPDNISLAFSGRAGFHVTLPTTLLGDIASPHLTSAYKRWASAIKDALGLITLDAPSRRTPEWWWNQIAASLGGLPLAVQDRDAFALSLRRVGIYSRRRMIRREGSRHPGSGLYKIPLLPHELALGASAISRLARQPRMLPARLAPAAHPGLSVHLHALLAEIATEEAQRQAETHRALEGHTHFAPERDAQVLSSLTNTDTPLCIQRLLARPAPDGASNLPLMSLAAYCRASGMAIEYATLIAHHWLLRGVTNPETAREREDSARSVVKAAYNHHYLFARRFIAPLQLVSDDECADCPLRTPCYGVSR